MPVEVDGMADVLEDLDDLKDDFSGPQESWVVGTNVEYSTAVEFGAAPHKITPDEADVLKFEIDGEIIFTDEVDHPGTDPQPYFRPAINEVRLQGVKGFIRHNSKKDPEDIDSTREMLATLSFALENRIKDLAPVDIGNLQNSISAVPIGDIGSIPDLDDLE